MVGTRILIIRVIVACLTGCVYSMHPILSGTGQPQARRPPRTFLPDPPPRIGIGTFPGNRSHARGGGRIPWRAPNPAESP